jgi:hypothetical protein
MTSTIGPSFGDASRWGKKLVVGGGKFGGSQNESYVDDDGSSSLQGCWQAASQSGWLTLAA